MSFISLDSIHPYQTPFQPPSSAFEPTQRRSTNSKGVPSEDFDIPKYIDLTASLSTDSFDHANDCIFPAFEELLPGIGQAQESPYTESTNGRSSISPMRNPSATKERGGEQGSLTTPLISVPGSEDRAPTLRDKSHDPISSPLPPSPTPSLSLAPTNTALPLILDIQTEPSRDQEKADIGDGHKGDGYKGDGHKRDGHNEMGERDGDRVAKGATGVPGIRNSSKRTADNAGLNEGGEGASRSEKVQRTGSSDIDEGMSDREFTRRRSLPAPVFRYPPYWRDSQERKNTRSSGRPIWAGESQDDPLVVEDNDEETGKSGTSTRATSVEPETETTPLSSHPGKEPKTLGCLDALTAPDLPTESLDRPTSPDVAPPQHSDRRVGGEDDNRALAVANPPSTSTPLLRQQSEAGSFTPEDREWEIRKIVGRRRAGNSDEYLVYWKKTWLPESEFGNAKRLLKEFKARGRVQRGHKPRRATQADKSA